MGTGWRRSAAAIAMVLVMFTEGAAQTTGAEKLEP
jgi:hypothetical protein